MCLALSSACINVNIPPRFVPRIVLSSLLVDTADIRVSATFLFPGVLCKNAIAGSLLLTSERTSRRMPAIDFLKRFVSYTAVACFVTNPAAVFAQDSIPTAVTQPASVSPSDQSNIHAQPSAEGVRFSFDRASWRDVFTWLSNEAGLALHMTDLPSGTFTYSDPNAYSTSEAIDRINQFLLPEGFSLVRSRGLLSVLNLRDSRSQQRLDALARTVQQEQIDALDDHEVVKCFFSLGNGRPSDLIPELTKLQLMTEPVALEASKRIAVIETAKKLRNVRDVIEAIRAEASSRESLVRQIELRHTTMDDVLLIARPHLGIDEGLTHNAEINVSSDASKKRLFVSGTPEAVKLLEGLVAVIDVEDPAHKQAAGELTLQSHRVRDENLTTVYDVLQTVLAGRNVRVSMEPSTNSIVALADVSTHQIIQNTVQEMEGFENIFSVVQLQTIDPYFAISLLNEMFDLNSTTSRGTVPNPKALKIDADPNGMRLFVRGPKDKVEEVKQVVENLDQTNQSAGERLVPVVGAKAESVLDRALATWSGSNPVLQSSNSEIEAEIIERAIHEDSEPSQALHQENDEPSPNSYPSIPLQSSDRSQELVSTASHGKTKANNSIEAKITSRGIVLQSDDKKALEEFEDHLRTFATNDDSSKVETIIYYLKYSSADEATQLLADLLDGATSAAESQSKPGELVKGSIAPPKSLTSLLGSYIRSSKEAPKLITSGTLTVISDARLNRLICVGTSTDLKLVEQFLSVIDKDKSLTSIETKGRSHVIELQHAIATEVADVIRDTYGDRVALTTEQKQAQQSQRNADRERSGQTAENNIQTSRSEAPQMSIAVHEISNSIVVTAPEVLFEEVKQLIDRLDQQSEQAVEVIFYPSPQGIEILRESLGQEDRSRSRDRRSDGGRR